MTKSIVLVVTTPISDSEISKLSKLADVYRLTDANEGEIERILPYVGCLFLYTWPKMITEQKLDSMKSLRFIQSALAGVNQIPFSHLRKEVIVSSNAGAYSDEVAEYAWSLILSAAKGIVRYDASLKNGTWTRPPPFELGKEVTIIRGKNLGVIGYGGIGRSVAKIARAFGVRVHAFSRGRRTEKWIRFFRGKTGLSKMLSQMDIVVLSIPFTRFTQSMIGKEELTTMKKDAILVNVGRAEVVDQASLYDHLTKNRRFIYATDVWWTRDGKEMFNPEFPFLSLPNFIGTPHASGPSVAVTNKPTEIAIDNLIRFLKGMKPKNIVDRAEYLT